MKFLYLLLFISTAAWSQAKVVGFHSNRSIIIEVFATELYPVDERVLFISHMDKKIVGFGKIITKDVTNIPAKALVEIDELVDHQNILLDDFVYPLEKEYIDIYKVPGFLSLTMAGDRHLPAKYKELPYYGVFTSDGHALDKKEWLVGLVQVQYGLTHNLTIKSANALTIDGYVNLGAKYQVIRNQHAKLSFNTLGGQSVTERDWIFQGGGTLTLPTNSKYQTHFIFNLIFDQQEKKGSNTEDFNLFKDSEIRNIYEYITDSWDRILLGPTYNFTLQTVGGTLSYMWVWDSFHMSLGVGTRDFTELRFGTEGYYPQFDLFWRI